MRRSNYHREWQDARVNFLIQTWGKDFFQGKRILELGSHNGYIGNRLYELGAVVHSVDGRKENVKMIRETYPHLNAKEVDLDTVRWTLGTWDIIINFGLLYHLERFHKEHLVHCINNCRMLFLETVIYDSIDPELYFQYEQGSDQSLSGRSGTPSTSFIENILEEEGVVYTKYTSSLLNGGKHRYDWTDANTKIYDTYARRFWVAEGNAGIKSPALVNNLRTDVTLLLQGKVTRDAYDFYLERYKEFPIIVSTWNGFFDDPNPPPNVRIYADDLPEDRHAQNLFRQIKSTANGLYYVDTPFVIKLRGDEYYSNLGYVIDLMQQNETFLITNSVFFRKWKKYRWHISDHLIGGTKENLERMFFHALERYKNPYKIPPEVFLTQMYLQKKYGSDFESRTNHEAIMRESFMIVDVNNLKPYKVVANGFKKTWYDEFDHIKRDSVKTMDEVFDD